MHPATPPNPPGLIIDAFGELRDQQEQVKEDMEVGHVWGATLRDYRTLGG